MTMLRHLGRSGQRYHLCTRGFVSLIFTCEPARVLEKITCLERRERIGMSKSLIVSAIGPGSRIHLLQASVKVRLPADCRETGQRGQQTSLLPTLQGVLDNSYEHFVTHLALSDGTPDLFCPPLPPPPLAVSPLDFESEGLPFVDIERFVGRIERAWSGMELLVGMRERRSMSK